MKKNSFSSSTFLFHSQLVQYCLGEPILFSVSCTGEKCLSKLLCLTKWSGNVKIFSSFLLHVQQDRIKFSLQPSSTRLVLYLKYLSLMLIFIILSKWTKCSKSSRKWTKCSKGHSNEQLNIMFKRSKWLKWKKEKKRSL